MPYIEAYELYKHLFTGNSGVTLFECNLRVYVFLEIKAICYILKITKLLVASKDYQDTKKVTPDHFIVKIWQKVLPKCNIRICNLRDHFSVVLD